MASESSERIGGFQVIRRLAMGQTSEILLARADGPFGFERPVVLKRLLPHFRDDPAFGRMFAREATAYARLAHPAIVKLYDFFAGDGQLVMVLEHVDGVSLERLVQGLAATSQHLDDRAALWVGWRIFTALAAAHAATDPVTEAPAPVVHRDVNPSNVLVPWDGHVKLGDFGVARVAGMGGDTQIGLVQGQFGYASPEQVKGETVTPSSDVYSASLVVWELLARRRAFVRGTLPDMDLLSAMCNPHLPSLDTLRPDIEPALRRALARGLSTDPAQRTLGAEEMAGIIRAAGRLEEGREVLVQAAARVRRNDASGRIPPLFDEESITNAVASLKTLSIDDKPSAPPSKPATTTAPPPTPRARMTTDPDIPAVSDRAPVITSLMGWTETVPFEPAAHDSIPETLRGDIPAPVPFSSSSAGSSAQNTERNPAPPPAAAYRSSEKSEAVPLAVTSTGGLSAIIDSALGPMANTPSNPPLASMSKPSSGAAPIPGSIPPNDAIPATLAYTASPPEPAEPIQQNVHPYVPSDPPGQPTDPMPLLQPGPLAMPHESGSGIPSTRHAPPKPLDPVPPTYVPPVIGMQNKMPSHPPRPLDREPAHPLRRLAIGIPVALVMAGGAYFAWGHLSHEPVVPDPTIAQVAPNDPNAAPTPGTATTPPATASAADTVTDPAASAPATATAAPSARAITAADAAAAVATTATTATTATAPAGTPSTPTTPTAPVANGAADSAQLVTSAQMGGHRVFVDGKVVGNSPGPIAVPCGKHRVKVGSSGTETTLDLKCGETTTL